jgi:hypothetical protein
MSDYEFNLNELLAELENDESWEPDPEVRKGVAFAIMMEIGGLS